MSIARFASWFSLQVQLPRKRRDALSETCAYPVVHYRLGLDPKVLNVILNSSSGKTWVSDVYSPVPNVMQNVPSSNGYQGGFGSALMLKDLSLAQSAATRTQAPTPLGGLAQQFYRMVCAQGHSNKDFGYVFEMISATSKR